ncbi:hypothetical protein U3A55_03950 [Salarchaeum sp. III]|uniref:hypothetical protein n=1 Tax=Salarchaeum sp. III TaxID=3107927 RepID=UPI002EDB2380
MKRFQALVVGMSTFAGRQTYRPTSGKMQWLTANGDRRTHCKDDCEKSRTVGFGDYVDLDTGRTTTSASRTPTPAEERPLHAGE